MPVAGTRREATPDVAGAKPRQRGRVVIEHVAPEIDGGRFPAKRVAGDIVVVEADVFVDGHDQLAVTLLWRAEQDASWARTPMQPLGNDRWRGGFPVAATGRYRYTIEAAVDALGTWQQGLAKKGAAGQVTPVDLQVGAGLALAAAGRAGGEDAERLAAWASAIGGGSPKAAAMKAALDRGVGEIARKYPAPGAVTGYERELAVEVERRRAAFSTWYEMFPRSASPEPGRHGTFDDCIARLPYVAGMGFDVLYLPPIHPIGETFRKGPNNRPGAGPDDPGSPWAIGSAAGGHRSVHPALGTLEDFRRLVAAAAEHGIEIALDLAFQCSPDHPAVKEHPEWFRLRPDGSVQYAENPPKKYEDIYPFDFEGDAWESLWDELLETALFWVEQGVRIFRVDNPHTKPFRFWEWLIAAVRSAHPDVIFLSEAFTRPKVMYHLAKLGFSQSYTYFTWRNTRHELTEYFTELSRGEPAQFFRPNLWPNTPDILHEYLQFGGRPAFMARLVLAATLGASYGIYGPPFVLMEHRAREPGSEEYLDSEKYQLRQWNLDDPASLRPFIERVNRIRHENPALQSDRTLRFHDLDNEQMICYSKGGAGEDGNAVLVVVNLDPHHLQAGWTELDLDALGLDKDAAYQVHDLLTDARYLWHGGRNYVELDPASVPAHILAVRRGVHTEHDFEYFA